METMRKMSRTLKVAVVAMGMLAGTIGPSALAQGAAEHLAQADAAYKQRKVRDALEGYLRAIAAEPRNYEALWKASRTEVDLAEPVSGREADSLLTAARAHAEAAIQVKPADAEGHFSLARAVGRKALSVGVMDRIRFSKIVYAEGTETLKADSLHPGALHVMGMWNAEILRVNGFARAFAKTFLGAQLFSRANWDDAQRYLETAVRVDPARIVHKLDLAGIYASRDNKAKARELYEAVANAPVVEPNDDLYKKQAAERLRKL
jgi:tetratricopeptide (TPR) repeat protein